MLHKGYRHAITNIRLRKNLTQKETTAKAKAAVPGLKINNQMWSKYETGVKHLGKDELDIILAGLDCTETELWQETVRVQKAHYYKRADEVREEAPQYGTSMAAGLLQGLWALDIEALPPEQQGLFNQERTALGSALSNLILLVSLFKDRYWQAIAMFKRAQEDTEERQGT